MNPKRYERLRKIFLLVCDLPTDEQEASIKEHCGDDQTMREELAILLHMDAKKTGLLESPTLTDEVKQRLTDAIGPQASASIPERIGHYKIVKQIGGGGMGDVFQATQDNPKRTVAIKMIRSGVASHAMLKRFEHEAHVLGLLQHPGIAQIYEAGTADTGQGDQPYFAMELVNGDSLTDYVKQKNLGTRESLELIAELCDAIQHAHSKGVIHRDLKPGNILITKDGQPKILDFGVARAIDSDIQTTTLQTDIGQLIGTIQYMSPEQAKGNSDDIDTRSDVYALGVLMFEVLANKLPYELTEKMVHEAVRVIREDDPTRLSSINTKFRGDVETIVAKALEKDKDRRYQTAAELAADIRHYLNDEPIVARPASAMYQFRKFTQRNKALVVGVAVASLALFLGVIGTSTGMLWAINEKDAAKASELQAINAQTEAERLRDLAETKAKTLTEVRDFLLNMFKWASPEIRQGRDVSVNDLLASAAKRIDEMSVEPEIVAELKLTIASTYMGLGNATEAALQAKSALELIQKEYGIEHPLAMTAMNDLGIYLAEGGQLEKAKTYFDEALDLRKRILGIEHRDTLVSMNCIANLLRSMGKLEDARDIFIEAIETSKRLLGNQHPDTLTVMNNYAVLLMNLGQLQDSAELLQTIRSAIENTEGDMHPEFLSTTNNLSHVLQLQGRHDEAEELLRNLLPKQAQVLGETHPDYLRAKSGLGTLLYRQGKIEEAIVVFRENYNEFIKALGEDHPSTMIAASNLSGILTKNGNLVEAKTLATKLLDARTKKLGALHPKTLIVRSRLAAIASKQGNYEDSLILYRDLISNAEKVMTIEPFRLAAWRISLGQCLTKLQRFDEAEEVLQNVKESSKPTSNARLRALVSLYEAWDKPEKAAEYRALLEKAEKETEAAQETEKATGG